MLAADAHKRVPLKLGVITDTPVERRGQIFDFDIAFFVHVYLSNVVKRKGSDL